MTYIIFSWICNNKKEINREVPSSFLLFDEYNLETNLKPLIRKFSFVFQGSDKILVTKYPEIRKYLEINHLRNQHNYQN